MKTINDINDALYDTQIPHNMTIDRRILIFHPKKKVGNCDYLLFEIRENDKPNMFDVIDGETCLYQAKSYEDTIDYVKKVINSLNKLKQEFSEPTNTQHKIVEILDSMKDLLLYKNQKYGDSAINPKKIFYKGDSTNSILIRLDDKLGRVMSNPDEKPRTNDVADIIGYCTLLLISMGVTPEDLAKFKD